MWRVAVVGAGRMGRQHIEAWSALSPRVSVVAVVGRETPPPLADCDIVDVCVPTPAHADLVLAGLAAGRHVLVEKPLALTLADADRILDAARSCAGSLMVAHVVRFFPAYRRLLSMAGSGALGAPLGGHAYRYTGADPSVRWLADPAQSGGALVDLLVHDYDVLNAVLGRPESVVAQAGAVATALVSYAGGRTGSVAGSMTLPPAYPFAAGARFVFEDGVAEALPDGVLRIVDGTGVRDEAVDPVDPYVEQARYFLDCLDAGAPPTEGTGEQARAALAVAVAARRSAETGDRCAAQSSA